MSMDGQADRCHLSIGIFPGKLSWLYQVTALVHLLCSSPLLHEQSTGHCHATGWGCPSYHHCIWAWGLTSSRPLKQSNSSTQNCTTSSTSLTRYPLHRYSPSGAPICWVPCYPTKKKWDHSPSGSLNNHCDKRTHVNPQEVKARSEHSTTQGELVLEAGLSFKQQGQEPTSPPSSPARATTDPDNGTVAGSLRSTRNEASSDSDLSREDEANSDMDTASGDCVTCLDTDKEPYEPHRRNTRRGYKLPVGSAKAVSGLRINWKGSVKAARLCGDTTLRVFKHCGIVTLWKTTTPLRCVGWWSGLTNCSTLQQPLTPKFTPETQRLKPMTRQRLWYCHWNNTIPTFTVPMKREQLGPWSVSTGCIQVMPLDAAMSLPVWG